MDSSATPTLSPPNASGASVIGTSEPKLTSPAEATVAGATAVEAAGPQLRPPGAANGAGTGDTATIEAMGGITGTWTTGKVVDALWSINETRNAWIHVAAVGWKKIYNGSDGAFTALTTIASQARQTGRPVTFRQEADGMVYEIYLW